MTARGAEATCLLLVDLQNDFLHPGGAYGRAGQSAPALAALPARLAPLVGRLRRQGGLVAATLFTLVPGRDGAPLISPHLHRLRPFLGAGDFAPGAWGQQLVDELGPVEVTVEKIAYSAFHATRLDWVLRRCAVSRLIIAGIVTDGGVASTARDAQVHEYEVTVLADGCAAFSAQAHASALAGLAGVARVTTIDEALG